MPSLSGFTSALHGGGARANQFMVSLGGAGAAGLNGNTFVSYVVLLKFQP